LAACEGALLVVDSTQGVEAQTMANVYLALDNNLEIIPIINKIDLPSSNVAQSIEEIENIIGLDCSTAVSCSAKTGEGVIDILEAIVHHLPPPPIQNTFLEPLQALIFDSYYDPYRGVVVFFRVMNGTIAQGDSITFCNSGWSCDVLELGVLTPPNQVTVSRLCAGEVGYLAGNIKDMEHARVGDTITLTKYKDHIVPLAGYSPAKPMVFAGLYPSESDDYEALRDAMNKLKLNDAAFSFTPETSTAMGFGFRCGFLGLLHMDIVQERLEREYDLDIVITAPSVVYKVILNEEEKKYEQGNEKIAKVIDIDTPAKLPDPSFYKEIQEPYVRLEMITPQEYTGSLMELAQQRRGIFQEVKYLTSSRTALIYEVRENQNKGETLPFLKRGEFNSFFY